LSCILFTICISLDMQKLLTFLTLHVKELREKYLVFMIKLHIVLIYYLNYTRYHIIVSYDCNVNNNMLIIIIVCSISKYVVHIVVSSKMITNYN